MKRLEVKISDEEAQVLEQYCKQSEKTKTDVIRSYIRQLKRKVKKRCDPAVGPRVGERRKRPVSTPGVSPGDTDLGMPTKRGEVSSP